MEEAKALSGLEVIEPNDARRGFALPAAIGAIVIVGILVTTGFFMAQQEMRIGVATENAGMAFYVAERGASEVLDTWDNSVMEAQSLFVPSTFTGTTSEGTWEVDVRRVGSRMYFLDARGTITAGGDMYSGATRRIGMVARHLELGIEPPAAVTAQGGLDFKGSPPQLVGQDVDPWTGAICSGPPVDQIGFLSDDTSMTISPGTGMGAGYCDEYIFGDPCVQEDIPLVDETLEPFYDADYWGYLTDIADHEFSSGTSSVGPSYVGPDCNYNDPQNWGDPSDPTDACGLYFPMIYFNTSVTIGGNGAGQGILLIDGDLDMQGNYQHFGIIVVKGAFTSGGSPEIYGAVIAESIDIINGTPLLQWSNCAVQSAINLNASVARARPLTRRSFVDLSNLSN